ncbi:hypothetical protein IPG41_01980 [Candidatus Peregrinibacteria bacterium]|nr:MAG: hypothetical protein IPG41_01980 [Candidatus Peregrinibacteria bacterium]
MEQDLKKYIFQTGHGKGLAKIEIESISTPSAIVDEVEDGFVVEGEWADPIAHLNRLGGTVRILEVIQAGPSTMPLNFEEWVSKAVETEVKNKEGKIRYGVSMHPKSEKVLTKILIGSKKRLKDKLGNVRFVNKNFQNLSSVQAWHEHLLEDGAIELQLFQGETKWYLAKTVAIQDFESYSHRDYNRPARNAKNGMFPPKLAQVLINLALGARQPSPEVTIVDPFCGSGTVLQEAWLMGCKAQGSDISAAIIADAKENLDWLHYEYRLEGSMPTFTKDATQLTKADLPDGLFFIVSETSLGPAISKPLPAHHLKNVQEELEKLYDAFFSNLKKIAPAGTVMVFTAPYHRQGNERLFLPHLPKILAKHSTIVPLSDHERPSLFFERKDQRVSREIWKVQMG